MNAVIINPRDRVELDMLLKALGPLGVPITLVGPLGTDTAGDGDDEILVPAR